jgi:hypothetical protein
MKRHSSAWRGIAILCASLNLGAGRHAPEAASSSAVGSDVPAVFHGTWIGEESNSRQGRDWVALVVRDDGEIDWYDDLPAKGAPDASNHGKPLKMVSISDTHLTLTYEVRARNDRLRGQTVVSTLVLDLEDGLLVGHREFPLDPDRSMSLSRVPR